MYTELASKMHVGDMCEVGGNFGEIAFVGDGINGLPGGHWVGVRYVDPVGKNDGSVKGIRLFTCHANHGHILRPDKVNMLDKEASADLAKRLNKREEAMRASAAASPRNASKHPPVARTPPPASASASPPASSSRASPPLKPSSARSTVASSESARSAPPASPAYCHSDKLSHGNPATVIGSAKSVEETLPRNRVGLVYDERMGAHRSGTYHPEQPARIKSIFCRLENEGLAQRCVRVPARHATPAELQTVHEEQHVTHMLSCAGKPQKELDEMCADMDSVFMCPESTDAALLSAGSVVEATRRVCTGMIKRAVCIVRPPGHHAEPDAAMGFCLFGNVAVAASEARRKGWAKRILIVDWDAHHGNGTQRMFLNDPTVLFVSLHRFDRGTFYPGGPDGDVTAAGEGIGEGYNINIPWSRSGAGDAEYIAAFDRVVMPCAKEFNPDLVLISAGFDSAAGDPLGGCKISPEGYNVLTHKLLSVANGRLVLVLEGGYSLRAIAHSLCACVKALLGDPPMEPGDLTPGHAVHMDSISEVCAFHSRYWRCLASNKPAEADAAPTPPVSEEKDPVAELRPSNSAIHGPKESPSSSAKANAGSFTSGLSTPDRDLSGAFEALNLSGTSAEKA